MSDWSSTIGNDWIYNYVYVCLGRFGYVTLHYIMIQVKIISLKCFTF